MTHYAYDYEEGHYYVYSVGDNVEDESFLFPVTESQDFTDLVVKFIASLDGIVATGKIYDCDHVDCCHSKQLLIIEIACDIWCDKDLTKRTGQAPKQRDIEFLIKRLTVLNNRKAQHLRGERHG